MSTVTRHSLTVRISHWLVALSGILLLFSGFGQMPMYKRYNIVTIPGLAWSGNFEITLLLHYLGSAVFTAAIMFHLLYHWRRNELSILPRRGDIRLSIQGLKAMFGRAEEPHHEKFQAKQRIIYAVIGADAMLLIITGLVKSYKNTGVIVLDPLMLQWVAYLHTLAGMVFMLLFLAHVMALLLKQHRPLIPSMFSGQVSRDYAEQHHPYWQIPDRSTRQIRE